MKRLSEEQKKRMSVGAMFRYADMLCERLDVLKFGSRQELERLDGKIDKFLFQEIARTK